MFYNRLLPFILIVFTSISSSAAQTPHEAVTLNDEGVAALKEHNWNTSFKKFKMALQIDPTYDTARLNLAIAHNNLALYLMSHGHKFGDALTQFHQSLYIHEDASTDGNLQFLIRRTGKDPNNAADRITLAEQARRNNDLAGSVVEYSAALKLKDDPAVHRRLADIYVLLHEPEKASAERRAAIDRTHCRK